METTGGDRPWEGDGYAVSPYNFVPEVQKQYEFRQPVVIQDWTLLKLDHLPASRMYSLDEYKEVASLLDEAGVQEAVYLAYQYGTAKDDRVWEALQAIAKLGLNLKLRVQGLFATWGAGEYRQRIDKIVDSGADSLGLSAAPARAQLGHGPQSSESDERLRELPKAIEYARKKGLGVCVSTVYIGADGDFLLDFQAAIDRQNYYLDHGADSLVMADSRGTSTPEATRFLVQKLRAGLVRDVPIFFHARDNFGTASALVLAATSAGAWPQVSVNAIGDQSFASLEEVAMCLELLYGVRTGIKLDKLRQLSAAVERITGIPQLLYKPITGEHNTYVDYPPHYLGYVKGKSYRQLDLSPYDIRLVDMTPTPIMSYGLLSHEVVRAKLEQMGLPAGQSNVQEVYNALKRRLDSLGNKFPVMLNEAEVQDIFRKTLEE